MIYTHQNCQPGTVVYDMDKGERIPYVSKIDTETNTLIVCQFPLAISAYAEELLTFERKFTRVEALPSANYPNRFNCYGEVV